MKKYTVIQSEDGKEIIQFEENGRLYSIPTDETNSDYQAYLESLKDAAK